MTDSDAQVDQQATPEPHRETTKEAIMSVAFTFAIVFVFTRFVVASYVIPTGSMAPTLMGAHMRFTSPQTGDVWAVNPWYFQDMRGQRGPISVQGTLARPGMTVDIEDTIVNERTRYADVPLRGGDRIFVHKYLYNIFPPKRWDVAVFKFPGDANENYIKRIAGLPGETVWLADGDVFTKNGDDDWTIQRKPTRVQRELWYPLFSSEYRPLNADSNPTWVDRWESDEIDTASVSFRVEDEKPARLRWNTRARAIDDWVSYNDVRQLWNLKRYPVSDLRMRAAIRAESDGFRASARLGARGHIFEARIEDGVAELRMAKFGQPGGLAWDVLDSTETEIFRPGRLVNVEFWHVDQSLQLWIDGKRVAHGEYDWSPQERLNNVFDEGIGRVSSPPVYDTSMYRKPRIEWRFEGSPAEIHRVGLDRDVFYQPATGHTNSRKLARGAGPTRTFELTGDQFFMLGDNSPSSADSRAWGGIDPWVAHRVDGTIGVVNRSMLMGKAFLVFYPAGHRDLEFLPKRIGLPPDFGRVRLIR